MPDVVWFQIVTAAIGGGLTVKLLDNVYQEFRRSSHTGNNWDGGKKVRTMNLDRVVREILPYRMQAVDTLNLAVRLQMRWAESPPISIHINGNLAIEGNLNAFTNPAIEAGLVHCRALLEFLGLCVTSGNSIVNIKKRRGSDLGIESFTNANGPLRMINPDDALNRYAGGRKEAEDSLLAIFQITNKGIAHVTEDLIDNPEHRRLIEIASRGVPPLVVSRLYTPLGLRPPAYKLTSRLRNGPDQAD